MERQVLSQSLRVLLKNIPESDADGGTQHQNLNRTQPNTGERRHACGPVGSHNKTKRRSKRRINIEYRIYHV